MPLEKPKYFDELSLVVLNYNSFDDTIKCVEQLLSFSENFNIIVVDNASPNNSQEILRNKFKDVKNVSLLFADENKGYSAGNNIGIKFALKEFNSKYVGILNPDVIIPDANLIYKTIEALNIDDKYVIAGASPINNSKHFNASEAGWRIPTAKELVLNHSIRMPYSRIAQSFNIVDGTIAEVDCVAGCYFIAKSDFLKEIDYLDEGTFLYNEENILGIKAKRLGYKELILLDEFYLHNHRHSSKDLKGDFRALKISYDSRAYLCRNYYSKSLILPLYLVDKSNYLVKIVGRLKKSIKK
ncbi:glycosyltransferase family 2 protein [Streptococcaceae bacterium ESL0687]|nr:glycosyltransferase family 2 protein [Streptococcaceae bacterium ESL0687]